MTPSTTSREFFDHLYAQSADPWNFAADPYELDRYAATLRALGDHRFSRAFEPGCSVGVLTESLAKVCTAVEALDISPIAVRRAQERCRNLPNVTVRCGALPQAIPSGSFDLLMFSEIGYYFTESQLELLTAELVGHLERGGSFVAVHWLGHSEDHLLSGDCVHEILRKADGLTLQHEEKQESFRLDRWLRV